MSIRAVKKILRPQPTLEGAGVKLQRGFGFGDPKEFDPFLLFDDFRNDNPEEYLAGFPWHPHRGIIHQEMPKGDAQGRMHGFQLWANLPSSLKMTTPRYQDVAGKDIPEVVDDDGTRVRVVCGNFWGTSGPVDGIAADPIYLDVSVPPGKRKTLPVETTRHAFAYVFAGSGTFRNASDPKAVKTDGVSAGSGSPAEDLGNRSLLLFDRGDEVTVQAGEHGIRFLLVSGKPIEEPVAWYGPIVMNTEDELRVAVAEMRAGTFIKHGK